MRADKNEKKKKKTTTQIGLKCANQAYSADI